MHADISVIKGLLQPIVQKKLPTKTPEGNFCPCRWSAIHGAGLDVFLLDRLTSFDVMRSGINRSSPKCVAFNMISEEIALAKPYELGPLRNSEKINRNCPDKIKCQILSRQIFVSSFASAWKISKLSNSVNFWSAWAHKSGQHSLPMDKNSDRQDSSEVVQWKYLNPRVSQKKRKDNYSPSSDNKTNPVQLHVFGSFCDKWSAS